MLIAPVSIQQHEGIFSSAVYFLLDLSAAGQRRDGTVRVAKIPFQAVLRPGGHNKSQRFQRGPDRRFLRCAGEAALPIGNLQLAVRSPHDRDRCALIVLRVGVCARHAAILRVDAAVLPIGNGLRTVDRGDRLAVLRRAEGSIGDRDRELMLRILGKRGR